MSPSHPPPDRIQALLDDWASTKNPDSREEAFRMLYAEWRRGIRRLVQGDEDERDALLQDAMWHACTPAANGRLPVHAPEDATHPRAWRTRVLRTRLIDRFRRRTSRRRTEQAFREDLSRGALQTLRARERDQQEADHQLPDPVETPPPPPEHALSPEDEAVAHDQERFRRDQVLAQLARLAVRRRVLIALVLQIDPTPWAEELVAAIASPTDDREEMLDDLRHRIDTALSPCNESPAFTSRRLGDLPISWAIVHVLDPGATSTEPIRKALDRAFADLTRLLEPATAGGDR